MRRPISALVLVLCGCGQTVSSNIDERRPLGSATGVGGDASSAGGHAASSGSSLGVGGSVAKGGSGQGAFGASAGKSATGGTEAGGSGQGTVGAGGKAAGGAAAGGASQGGSGPGVGGKGQGAFGAGGSGQGAFGGTGKGGSGVGGSGVGGTGKGGSGVGGSGVVGGSGQGAFGAGGSGAFGGSGEGAFGGGQGAFGGVGQGGSAVGGSGQGAFGAGGQGGSGTTGKGGSGAGGKGQGGLGPGAGGSGQGAGGSGQGAGGFPVCQPGTGTCLNNDTVERCNASGTGFFIEVCDVSLGIFCDPPTGTCVNPCTAQLVGTTTIGCEYFPTVTSNGALYAGFHFAVSVANATLADAHVSVMRAGHTYATATVPPGGLSTMTLPWVDALRHDYAGAASGSEVDAALTSAIVAQGGYILASDAPVSVFQFNPLEYEIPQPADGSCPDPHGTGKCNSFTNDASLLLPQNALGTEYIVASRATLNVTWGGDPWSLPGLVAITASKNGTTVQVKSSAFVRAGAGVKAMSPGDTQSFTLDRGDVLQLLAAPVAAGDLGACVAGDKMSELCAVPASYDLTGTIVTSDKPIVVIGGHDCDFVPWTKFACDHLEQSLFPLNTWGTSAIVTAPQSVLGAPANDGKPDVHVARVIAGQDGVTFKVDPPLPGFVPPPPLAKGAWVELPMVATDYVVTATGPIQVVQYMAGGDVVDPKDIQTPKSHGDPSMSLAVPTAQFRRSSTFLAPSSYELNFVNVIAPTGQLVTLDGAPLGGPPGVAIGASGYTVRRVAIPGGAHKIESNVPVGVVVYGYGTYTSYMYPGGLALEVL